MSSRSRSLLLAAMIGMAAAAHADPAPFDLAGPDLEVKVSRGAATLPISEVPNLAPGDRLWIKADLPATQSAHYLMVAAFLRGSTNPPPASWFFRCKTWSARCARQGLSVTVPPDAQQVLVFLAPVTSGDFRTLVNAVRGRPGAFVRASQDLNQATLDRARLEDYLAAIRSIARTDPSRLKDAAPLLARSLAIKVDEKCLDRIPELQAPCLMQGQDSLILNDGHSTSIVEALTSGPANDLAMEASFTPQLSYGYYSPYIASVLDIARILDSFHTAQYQYIPALASQHGDRVSLALNTPPSFYSPMSVLVAALPAIEAVQLPPLHPVDPKQNYCATRRDQVLPVEGAPLVFSTGYAHDMFLSVAGKDGKSIELPARADAMQGGFVIATPPLAGTAPGDSMSASLHGYWGFEKYDGPRFRLVSAAAQTWRLADGEEASLIVGRDNVVRLKAGSVSCIDDVKLRDAAGNEQPAAWKTMKPDEVELTLPLQKSAPGALTLLVAQYGASQPQSVALQAFAEAGHLGSFVFHAGDAQGVLKGSRLDEVASLSVKGVQFLPGKLSSTQGSDQLPMLAPDAAAAAALAPGDNARAKVLLKDGRVRYLNVIVDASRPRVALLGKSVQMSSANGGNIRLANDDELPQDAKLTFSLRAQAPQAFASDAKIEVAAVDGSFATTLSAEQGAITLADAQVAVVTIDPAKAFGPSAFGPLQFRIVTARANGDWQPLATLVRLPQLKGVKCPGTADLACKLSGSNLFLVEAVASDPLFEHSVPVPDGFPGDALPVPRPTDGQLYVKLRDDPSVINVATLGVQQMPASADDAARAEVRHAAASVAYQPGGGAPAPPAGSLRPTVPAADVAPSSARPSQAAPAPSAPAPSSPAPEPPAPQPAAQSAPATSTPSGPSISSGPASPSASGGPNVPAGASTPGGPSAPGTPNAASGAATLPQGVPPPKS